MSVVAPSTTRGSQPIALYPALPLVRLVLPHDVPRKRRKQGGHPILTNVALLPPSLTCIWSRQKNASPSQHNLALQKKTLCF